MAQNVAGLRQLFGALPWNHYLHEVASNATDCWFLALDALPISDAPRNTNEFLAEQLAVACVHLLVLVNQLKILRLFNPHRFDLLHKPVRLVRLGICHYFALADEDSRRVEALRVTQAM